MTLLCYQDSSGLVYQYSNTCDTTNIGVNENNLYPYSFAIYPNPTSELINIKYNVSAASRANVVIYDAMGHLVRTHYLETPSGIIAIKKNDLLSGLYLCSLQIDEKNIITKKIIIHHTK